MTELCQRCHTEPKEKGSFYVTTKLVSTTTKLVGLRFCKDCSDGLSTVIWDVIFSYLRKTDNTQIETKESKKFD